MNKKIKRIISLALIMGAFSAVAPVNYLNLITTKAYAYNSSDDIAFLQDIDLNHGTLNFSKTRTSYDVNVSGSVDQIDLTADPEDSDYEVTIDGETKTGQWTKTIDLKKGKNKIAVKSKDSVGDNGPITYYVNITRGSSSNNDEEEEDVYLDNITLSDGDISFSRNKTTYNVNVAQSVSEIRVKADPENVDEDVVTINGVTVDEEDKYRKTIALNNGKNVVTIVVEDNDGENGNEKTYTLNINRGGSTTAATSVGEIDNTQDDIYLDDLVLEDGTVPISFRPKVSSYAVDVKEDWEDIIIKASPDDDDYTVRINGDKASYDGGFRKRVTLDKGKNVIKIKVSNEEEYDENDKNDEYKERTYTLTVYRGTSQGSASVNSNSSNSQAAVKANQWVNNNGKWVYNDALGNPLKNIWFFDKNYGRNYYLQDDGTMATGWVSYNGQWYHTDGSGAMQTGWINDNGTWYYLDSSGVMLSNTTVGIYKLGPSGAWVK